MAPRRDVGLPGRYLRARQDHGAILGDTGLVFCDGARSHDLIDAKQAPG